METYKIGKNIIENLTTGMYPDSRIIFREYIQNAADQIDLAHRNGFFIGEDLEIGINVDNISRTVRIEDNATGIKSGEAKTKLANIADSDKDRDESKGFRGIGRLGGLAYCDALKFITSHIGEETETILTYDAKTLRQLISDKTVKDSAVEILNKVISFDSRPSDANKHFFAVILENIRAENNELLEIKKIDAYIRSNAPVPYNNKFIFDGQIYEYANNNNFKVDEYKIHLNGTDVLKDYCTGLYDNVNGTKKRYDEIVDVKFKEFRDLSGELIAWMWFGLSSFEKQIPEAFNEMRGLRLRKENIQIGDSDTLVHLFKEQRGNFYFIGEVHAVHKDLIPNARRDYFNENKTRNEFEALLRYYFTETLHKLYHEANKVKNLIKKEGNFQIKHAEFVDRQKSGFIAGTEASEMVEELSRAESETKKAFAELEKIKDKAKGNEVFERVISAVEEKHLPKTNLFGSGFIHSADTATVPIRKERLLIDDLHQYDKKERKLVSKIYQIIKSTLPDDIALNLIKKIHEELNRIDKKSTIS